MWVKNTSALFIQGMAFTTLLLLGSARIHAAEEQAAYQPHLTALTEDPAFQEYLRDLKRKAAKASAQPAIKPVSSSQPSTQQRVIVVSDESDESAAAPNTTGRFIFTSTVAKPVAAGPTVGGSVQVNTPATTGAATVQDKETTRAAQIEQLRQRASGSDAQ